MTEPLCRVSPAVKKTCGTWMVVPVLFLITRTTCVCATVLTHLLEALTFSEILCSIRCLDLAVPLQVLLCVLLILSLGH